MYKRAKIASILMVLAIGIGFASGCQTDNTSNTGNHSSDTSAIHYTTEANMNELDYKMFVGERLNDTQLLIHARLTVSNNIASKEFPIDEEIRNTESALQKIQKYIDEISVTRPPKERSEDQAQILQSLTDVHATMQTYLDYLKAGNITKAQDSVAVMKSDYEVLGTLGI